jgi:fibrillarin-like pre-rRNA processing protein
MKQIFEGVYYHNKDFLTKNLTPGKRVYGEKIIKFKGEEYRVWHPRRSKMAAALKKGLKNFKINSKSRILYLGCAEGTTVSHFSDIAKNGYIVGIEISPFPLIKFLDLCNYRKNIAPILEDAGATEKYKDLIKDLDFNILFEDVATPNQITIFEKASEFINSGYGYISLKSRCIDVTKPPKVIYNEVKDKLSENFEVIEVVRLDPFEKDHAMFVVKIS